VTAESNEGEGLSLVSSTNSYGALTEALQERAEGSANWHSGAGYRPMTKGGLDVKSGRGYIHVVYRVG
jgi:hypothetical protein